MTEEPVVHSPGRRERADAPVDTAVTVLVDTARFPAHGRWWAHLASDTSVEELHAFAAVLGLPRRAFEGDHYDIRDDLVATAVAAGARLVTTRELLRGLQRAGLRTPKRRGEKVLATREVEGGRVDVVRADTVPAPHGVHRAVVRTGDTVLLASDGDLPVLEVPRGEALGFRRRWRRTASGTDVVHDGLFLVGDPAAQGVPAVLTGLDHWWVALLA